MTVIIARSSATGVRVFVSFPLPLDRPAQHTITAQEHVSKGPCNTEPCVQLSTQGGLCRYENPDSKSDSMWQVQLSWNKCWYSEQKTIVRKLIPMSLTTLWCGSLAPAFAALAVSVSTVPAPGMSSADTIFFISGCTNAQRWFWYACRNHVWMFKHDKWYVCGSETFTLRWQRKCPHKHVQLWAFISCQNWGNYWGLLHATDLGGRHSLVIIWLRSLRVFKQDRNHFWSLWVRENLCCFARWGYKYEQLPSSGSIGEKVPTAKSTR